MFYMYRTIHGKHTKAVSYREFVKELAHRTGNTFSATKAVCDEMTNTIVDMLSTADEETAVVLRPVKGLRIRAVKQLEPQRYQPSSREPYPRKVKIIVKASAERPIRVIDVPSDTNITE